MQLLEVSKEFRISTVYSGWEEWKKEKKGQKELAKLETFLEKYQEGTLTMEDISNLDIKLSIGTIKCLGIAKGEEEITKLKG